RRTVAPLPTECRGAGWQPHPIRRSSPTGRAISWRRTMSTPTAAATSLQAKLAAFVATLEPAELELFAVIAERALGDDVETFSTPAAPQPIPIPYPIVGTSSNQVSEVLNNFGAALNILSHRR